MLGHYLREDMQVLRQPHLALVGEHTHLIKGGDDVRLDQHVLGHGTKVVVVALIAG